MNGFEAFLDPPSDFNPSINGAGCFIEFDEKFLYLRRAEDREQGKTWCIPGGKIEAKEDPKTAAIREVLEEVGIVLDSLPMSFIGTLHMRLPERDTSFHMFHVKLNTHPEIQLNLKEHTDFQWVSLHLIETLPLIRGGKEAFQIYQNWRNKTPSANS